MGFASVEGRRQSLKGCVFARLEEDMQRKKHAQAKTKTHTDARTERTEGKNGTDWGPNKVLAEIPVVTMTQPILGDLQKKAKDWYAIK